MSEAVYTSMPNSNSFGLKFFSLLIDRTKSNVVHHERQDWVSHAGFRNMAEAASLVRTTSSRQPMPSGRCGCGASPFGLR
jgi:hypothetical protein